MLQITSSSDLTDPAIKAFIPQSENFERDLGGDVFIVEDALELSADTLKFADMTDKVGDYFIVFIVNNNSGGPTYVIPSSIYNLILRNSNG